jgi:hypothetical protein
MNIVNMDMLIPVPANADAMTDTQANTVMNV